MNFVSISGSLGRDAELKYLNNGDPVCSFSVADSQGREKPTIWWRCSLFGKRGQSLSQFLTKGQSVTVVGTITEREWEKDGVKQKSMDVRVSEIALQGGRKDAEPQQERRQAPKPVETFDDDDSQIPF
jgi:single-strand DNA-binding protein